MTTDKTDELIREKMEQFPGIPDDRAFDKQRSWERMRFRLEQPASRRLPWWKYAAAILILASGTYGVFHSLALKNPSAIPSVNLSSHAEKRMPANPQQTPEKERASIATLQKKTKEVKAKTVNPEKKAKASIMIKSGKRQIATDPTIAVVPTTSTGASTASSPVIAKDNDDRAADPLDGPHPHPIIKPGPAVHDEPLQYPPVTAAASQKLPIVYYKELVQTGAPEPEDLHPAATGKFSIRLTAGDDAGHFLATRRSSRKPLSIQLSPK